MLWDASEGNPADIPEHYLAHLNHEYIDGDISLVPAISKFEYTESIEDFEWEEAVELLGKVNPDDWPLIEDIEGVNVEELLKIYDEDASTFDYVEDNLGTAEKVEKVIKETIKSVLGEEVDKIRSRSGQFPSAANKFLQDSDGTFAGSFMHGDHKFLFEIAPMESGWLCTYRLSEQTLDKLPPIPQEDKEEDDPKKKDYTRRIRNRGWN